LNEDMTYGALRYQDGVSHLSEFNREVAKGNRGDL